MRRLAAEMCVRYRCRPEKGGLAGSSGEACAGGVLVYGGLPPTRSISLNELQKQYLLEKFREGSYEFDL